MTISLKISDIRSISKFIPLRLPYNRWQKVNNWSKFFCMWEFLQLKSRKYKKCVTLFPLLASVHVTLTCFTPESRAHPIGLWGRRCITEHVWQKSFQFSSIQITLLGGYYRHIEQHMSIHTWNNTHTAKNKKMTQWTLKYSGYTVYLSLNLKSDKNASAVANL